MVDHHDDRLDSALDLLGSRQWAGPATNPVLEKQFMQPNQESRGLNLRLVLGIAGALIGCGAVAAATRPAWRAAIFGATPEAPKVVAARVTAAPEPTAAAAAPVAAPARIVRRAAPPSPAPVVDSVPAQAPAPAPMAVAAESEEASEALIIPDGVDIAQADESEWLRNADPECYYQDALAAYLDRYVAGDAEGCAAIARKVDGTNAPAEIEWQLASALQRLFAVNALTEPSAIAGSLRFNIVLDTLDGPQPEGENQVFEITGDAITVQSGDVFLSENGENVITLQGAALPGASKGSTLMFKFAVPPSTTNPAPANPRR